MPKTKILFFILLMLNIQVMGFNQSPEIGAGLFYNHSQYKYYNNCIGPYLELGFNISKHFQIGVQYSYLNGNRYNVFSKQIILYKQPFTPGHNDTIRDVTTQYHYICSSTMMKLKITLNPESKVRMFLMPYIGLSTVKEIITHNNTRLKNSQYSDLYHTLGLSFGLGTYIDKDKNIMLNAEFGTGCIYSENFFTDDYIPSYNDQNLTFTRFNLGISYRFINE